MVRHIDRDFLTNRRQYRHAEKFWRDLWERLVAGAGVAGTWQQPWLGTPLRDGDPMFRAVSHDLGRGVRVIQHEPTSNDLELVWWLDRFGEEGIDPVIEQLVISCALSKQAADQAQQLLWSWVTRGQVEYADRKVEGR
jgi:hypothetical protein